jgi:hypothetical protein
MYHVYRSGVKEFRGDGQKLSQTAYLHYLRCGFSVPLSSYIIVQLYSSPFFSITATPAFCKYPSG